MARRMTLWNELRPRSFEMGRYTAAQAGRDALAGLTVAVVAIPLALAFAIASGVQPGQGLVTAIVAGFLISLLGGSRTQIGGPTGAFIVVLYGVVEKFGYAGLVQATFMAGALLVLAGMLRLGKYVRLLPAPVVVGFTAGIAFIIFSGQLKDFFGFPIARLPADTFHQWLAYAHNAARIDGPTTATAILGLGLMVLLRAVRCPVPPPILAVAACTVAVWAAALPVTTIASRFGGIPQQLPQFIGWGVIAEGFAPARLLDLLPSVAAIAFLAGVESLLSALVADKMTGDHHKPNAELVAQGLANIGSVLLGGIAATGAIARTGVNARAGAATPVAGMVHAGALLAVMLAFAPLAGHIPLAALAAVLVMTSWDMSERRHLPQLLRGPRLPLAVFGVTFAATVGVNLTAGVVLGSALAALGHLRGRLGTRNLPV